MAIIGTGGIGSVMHAAISALQTADVIIMDASEVKGMSMQEIAEQAKAIEIHYRPKVELPVVNLHQLENRRGVIPPKYKAKHQNRR